MRFSHVLLMLAFLISSLQAAEEKSVAEVGLANYEATAKDTAELKRKLENYRKYYYSKLNTARTYAVREADAEEVKRIDEALSGKYVSDFNSKYGISAREYFDGKLRYLVKDFNKDLERAVKKLLSDGKTEDALFIKDTISFLTPYLEEAKKESSSGGKNRKKVTIEADKDWQETGVVLKKGSMVSISLSGTWAPGTVSKRNRIDRADADTYPLQLRIGQQLKQGGKKWDDFTVAEDGEMSARMVPLRRGARSEARGAMTMYIEWRDPVDTPDKKGSVTESKSLETVVGEIVDPKKSSMAIGAQKQSSDGKAKVYKFYLKSDEDWQDCNITVKKGQKVSITADGTWTPNKTRRPKQSADVFRYIVRVKNAVQTVGGKKVEFVCGHDGSMSMRATFYKEDKAKSGLLEGSLKMTIKVSD